MIGSHTIAYSSRQAATATSLSVRQITRAISIGEITSSKIGRCHLIAMIPPC